MTEEAKSELGPLGSAAMMLRRQARWESEQLKGFTQQGVDIGEKVGDWLAGKAEESPYAGSNMDTRIAAAQEQAREATQAAMDQASADAAAATTEGGETVAAATPATPAVSIAGFELPPEFVDYLQGIVAGGASPGEVQAALHEKASPSPGMIWSRSFSR